MRRLSAAILAAGLSLGFGHAASAADMPAKAPAYKAPTVAPVYNWTGIYLGGSLGGAWASDDWLFGTGVAPTTPNSSSIIGGGFVGAQWQWSNIVLGVEANFLWDRLKSDGTCPNPAFTCRLEPNRYWTVGPRAGWAMNNWLVYGTGGYAQTHIDTTTFTTATGAIEDATSDWHQGWFAGGGVEYALMPNVILGIEYTHVQANDRADNPARTVGAKIDTVRARASYLFNFWK